MAGQPVGNAIEWHGRHLETLTRIGSPDRRSLRYSIVNGVNPFGPNQDRLPYSPPIPGYCPENSRGLYPAKARTTSSTGCVSGIPTMDSGTVARVGSVLARSIGRATFAVNLLQRGILRS